MTTDTRHNSGTYKVAAEAISVYAETRPDVFLRLHQESIDFNGRQGLSRRVKSALYFASGSLLFLVVGLVADRGLFGYSGRAFVVFGTYGLITTVAVVGYWSARWLLWSRRMMKEVKRLLATSDLHQFDYTLRADDNGLVMESEFTGLCQITWQEIEFYMVLPLTVRIYASRTEWGMFAHEYLGDDAFVKLVALVKQKVAKGVDLRSAT